MALAAFLAIVAASSVGDDGPDEARLLRIDIRRLDTSVRDNTRMLETVQARLLDLTRTLEQTNRGLQQLQPLASGLVAPPGQLAAAAAGGAAPRPELTIQVAKDDWGTSGTGDMETVLRMAADQLWRHFADRPGPTIVVRRSKEGPRLMEQRGPNGEYIVKLDSADRRWAELAFQFAREFCAILANEPLPKPTANRWFEDALWQAGAIATLRRMSLEWKRSPPRPYWRTYAPSFEKHAELCLTQRGGSLPEGASLADWYRRNEQALRENPQQPKNIGPAACALLKLFEQDPQRWEAIGYLNLGKGDEGDTFRGYLEAWRQSAPARHRDFIDGIARLFGVE